MTQPTCGEVNQRVIADLVRAYGGKEYVPPPRHYGQPVESPEYVLVDVTESYYGATSLVVENAPGLRDAISACPRYYGLRRWLREQGFNLLNAVPLLSAADIPGEGVLPVLGKLLVPDELSAEAAAVLSADAMPFDGGLVDGLPIHAEYSPGALEAMNDPRVGLIPRHGEPVSASRLGWIAATYGEAAVEDVTARLRPCRVCELATFCNNDQGAVVCTVCEAEEAARHLLANKQGILREAL